jgi:hypothetical protein
MKKTRGKKSHGTVPLTQVSLPSIETLALLIILSNSFLSLSPVPDKRIGLVNVVFFVCKNKCPVCQWWVRGVRENARGTRQLTLSKGPEWMGHLPP